MRSPWALGRMPLSSSPQTGRTRPEQEQLPEQFGFSNGRNSVYTSRTMMFAELSALFAVCQSQSSKNEYLSAATDNNALSKKTATTRRRTVQRLTELYALDRSVTLFRILRQVWDADVEARPLLACLCAQARDPLFRSTTDMVLAVKLGETLTVEQICEFLERQHPGRFSINTRRSAARNLLSSWLQSGYFTGRKRKLRKRPTVTPTVVAYALALSALMGRTGQMLFSTPWLRMLAKKDELNAATRSIPRAHRSL